MVVPWAVSLAVLKVVLMGSPTVVQMVVQMVISKAG